MVLQQYLQRIPEQKVKQIMKALDKHEEDWNALQKELHENKTIEKLCKASNQSIYTTKLLQQCNIVRFSDKCKVIYNAGFFKINKVTYEKRLSNFFILLQVFSHHGDVTLPMNTDALTVLQRRIISDTPCMSQW